MIPFLIYQPPQQVEEQKTEILFNEGDVKKGLVNIDRNIFEYVQRRQYLDEKVSNLYLINKATVLAKMWQEETMFSSSLDEMVENENFKKIIEYGDNIIPSILSIIDRQPSNLVWALNFITEKRISENPISINEACELWVKWGKKLRLIN